ncbi:strawberry notch C-terminal domain-containing protein, partial [Acaryochloris marina NIES-2412]|uniref:strawberry notch C-terminal domain-containing protein n=1 Tax=Acaryochloris marina TaxID=155978 RepID=UPI00405A4828
MSQQDQLADLYAAEFLAGKSYGTIVEARSQAAQLLNQSVRPGSPLAKLVDESIEAGLVRAARSIIGKSPDPIQTYADLVDLYNRQPRLGVRSSTSVRQQAYSTPLPIAYLAANLGGITANSTVYEPSAGHGVLVLNAAPENCTINELNPDRAADLRRQGFTVTEQDASTYLPEQLHDVVIANPPFGRTKGDNGRAKRFQLPGNPRGTSQIDHAIAMQALKAMKPDGRAVLILGGKPETDPGERAEAYNSLESRGFFYPLYQQYGVTQHFTISGDLYKKQGAGWPLDVIVIEGRVYSQRPLPAVEPPKIYESFDELRGLLNENPQLPRLPDLHEGLDTPGRRESTSIHRQSPTHHATDGEPRLPRSNELPRGMDDRRLAGEISTFKGRDTDTPSQDPETNASHPRDSEPPQRRRGSEANVEVGQELGGQSTGVQREVDGMDEPDQSRGEFSSGSESGKSTSSNRTYGQARQHHPRGIPDRPENGLRLDPLEPSHHSEEIPMAEQFNTPYIPRSKGRSPGTLIPTNMAVSAQRALDKFEAKHGNIDEFVMNRLGYDSRGHLYERLYAEQIDSLALSFDQKNQSRIFLNGDQTGNGKGRFGAASIIDAKRRGNIPVFVTKNPQLYKSMLEDLADIGYADINPFITNNNERITLDNGRVLRTGTVANQSAEMNQIAQQQDLGGYDVIFTTYTQLQTVNGKSPLRRGFLLSIAERSSLILDEAHEAGGSVGSSGWRNNNAPSNRAEFVRELVDSAADAVFMSATATKDPAVMDLYARRTDAQHAVTSMSNLENTLKAGGIPLQQMMATQFVASGNMLRRERSFENISFTAKQVPVNHDIADGIAGIMRAIDGFDRAKVKALKELDKEVRKEAKRASEDNSIGSAGAESMSFSSLMHNAIEQGLLAQKAEATVQEAISALQRGEKPLIAVANTMDSFLGNFAKERGIQAGDPINISFGDVLNRYLTRSRDVTLTDYDGIDSRRPMTNEELGDVAVAAFEEAKDLIDQTDLSSIPLSSIDYIKHRLAQEGYSADEITGRKSIINYSPEGNQTYGLRPTGEIKTQGKINVVNRFNGGHLDAVILNRSGATGINLHASEKFADQRPRHMIMAQAERDINQVFQMLGRANRFGQVVEPQFTLVMADVPAEKRLGALLAKKMASLNANTTAARDSDLSIGNVTDFMNAAGEEVITELLEEHPEIDAMLSYPSQGSVGGTDFPLISRTTGRIPLLPIKQQAELYDLIETETTALIKQKEAMGENVLEADKLDLDARTIAKMEVVPADAAIKSEFTGPVMLEVVNAKVTTKPPTQLEIINNVRENLGQPRVKTVDDHDFDAIEDQAKEQNQGLRNQVNSRLKTYSQKAMGEAKTPEAASHLETKFDKQMGHFQALTNRFRIGSTVQLASAEGKVSYGVVANIAEKAKPLGSPAAPTNWKMQIITSEGKNISVPFSKINSGKPSAVTIKPQETTWKGESIYEDFDHRQQNQRTEMQIFTGNLIKAYEEHPKGKFVNFTTNQGQVRQGLIMPDDFDITKQLRERPVIFEEPYQVKAFLTEVTKNLGVVHDNPEKNLAIKADAAAKLRGTPIDHFVITVPSATRVGGKFFLNEDLLDAAQSEFFSVANRMEMQVAPENLEATLKVIMKDEGIQIAAFDFKDMARDYLGQMLPTMEMIEENQFEQQADFVPYVEPTKETAAQLDMLLQSGMELSETPQAEQPQSPPDQAEAQPTEDNTKQIAPPANQTGKAEKSVAQFLHEGGLAQEVLKGDDFHFEIKNGPYEPLVVERITNQLALTHYREQYGELQLDSEMVFGIDGRGKLNLEEVAVQNPLTGGEIRELDREFGVTFAQNIVNQGFAQAAVEQLPELLKEREAEQIQPDPVIVEEPIEVQPEASTQTEPEPIQTEPTPTKATEETAPEVEPPSATELPPEQTAKSNQGDEPSAIENPEVTPQEALSQPKGEVAQPQQESTAQQQEAPQPKPKPQAKPEDWPKYASALGRGHVIQARIKKVIAAYQQGTALDMKASISMG